MNAELILQNERESRLGRSLPAASTPWRLASGIL